MPPESTGNTEEFLRDCLEQTEQLVKALNVPLCCLLVYDEGDQFCRLLGTDVSSFTHTTESIGTKKPVPTADKLVFAMGSLSKPLVSLQWGMITNDKNQSKTFGLRLPYVITWNTVAYQLLNDIRVLRGKKEVTTLRRPVTIEDLIYHKAFPPMTSYLLGYGGRFMLSIDDFLENGAKIANDIQEAQELKEHNPESPGYSNCNYLFLLILLKELYNVEYVSDVFDKSIIEALGLKKTTFKRQTVQGWMKQETIPGGYDIQPNLQHSTEVEQLQYMEDDIQSVLLGGRTCAADYATIMKHILHAAYSKEEDSIIPRAVARKLLDRDKGRGGSRTHFGLYGSLSSTLPGCDSLNVCSRKEDKGSYTLGKLTNKSRKLPKKLRKLLPKTEVNVHYKGGTIKGYTASVYVPGEYDTFVIALTNGTGPLDAGDYACQNVLQYLLGLEPLVNIPNRVMTDDWKLAEKCSQSFHLQPGEFQPTDPGFSQFVGIHDHVFSNQWIEITSDGELIKHGSYDRQDRVQVRLYENYLRVFPTAIDKWTRFKDIRLILDANCIRVIGGDVTDEYERRLS